GGGAALRPSRHPGRRPAGGRGHGGRTVCRLGGGPVRGPGRPGEGVPRADGGPGMIQPRLVWELARKDLQLFAADRRGMALCFAVPIVLASAFGAIFHRPDATSGICPVVHVVDEDGSPLSRRVVAGLCSSARVRASAVDSATARRRLAEEGVVLVLPAGFG